MKKYTVMIGDEKKESFNTKEEAQAKILDYLVQYGNNKIDDIDNLGYIYYIRTKDGENIFFDILVEEDEPEKKPLYRFKYVIDEEVYGEALIEAWMPYDAVKILKNKLKADSTLWVDEMSVVFADKEPEVRTEYKAKVLGKMPLGL